MQKHFLSEAVSLAELAKQTPKVAHEEKSYRRHNMSQYGTCALYEIYLS